MYIPDADAGRIGEITDELDPNKEAGIFNPDPRPSRTCRAAPPAAPPSASAPCGHHGTGTPSAFSSRRAGGGGPGGGGLGQGGRGRPRRLGQTEAGGPRGLQWLKNHQSARRPLGRDGFSDMCKATAATARATPSTTSG
jgi:hypothetical protein